jgi:hypothetical protein
MTFATDPCHFLFWSVWYEADITKLLASGPRVNTGRGWMVPWGSGRNNRVSSRLPSSHWTPRWRGTGFEPAVPPLRNGCGGRPGTIAVSDLTLKWLRLSCRRPGCRGFLQERDRRFESGSLQKRVHCELYFGDKRDIADGDCVSQKAGRSPVKREYPGNGLFAGWAKRAESEHDTRRPWVKSFTVPPRGTCYTRR